MSSLMGRPQRVGALRVKLPHPYRGIFLFLMGLVLAAGAAILYALLTDASRKVVPWIAVALGFVALVLLLFLLRQAIQAVVAARPGAIEISVVSAAPGEELANASIATGLREALTEVYLSGPSVVPGESAPQDFVTDVRSVVAGAGKPGAFLAGFLSLLSPRRAYRVSCTAQTNGGPGRYGLTVEVAGYPWREVSVTTVWGDTWAEATRKAACSVAAYVLPRTSLSRRPPWSPWYGIKLSPELFFYFHEARRLVRTGRLEEALHHFDYAIAMDPLNSYIRIEKAAALDELGLWIDALAAYVDVVAIESWYDRAVWKRYRAILHDEVEGAPHIAARSPNGRAALQVARYRMICSLAAAERLASQWYRNTKVTQRQFARREEAARAIARLRPLLPPYASLMMDGHKVPCDHVNHDGTSSRQRKDFLQKLVSNDEAVLRRVFQFVAVEECAAMARDYSWLHLRRWARLPITQSAIRILPVWAALRYHYVECYQGQTCQVTGDLARNTLVQPWLTRPKRFWRRNGQYSIKWLTELDKTVRCEMNAVGEVQWPPCPDGVAKLLRKALRRRFWRKNGWQDHYNGACTFAVCMLTPGIKVAITGNSKPTEKAYDEMCVRNVRLVQYAVNRLSRAVVAADGQFAAGKSVWLRRGDQDLDNLRATDIYATFINRYLPQVHNAPDFPNPTLAVVSQHMAGIVQRYAAVRASFWRQECDNLLTNTANFDDEFVWWELLRAFCHDYGHWQTRWRMISHATHFTGGTTTFAMPDFEQIPQQGPEKEDLSGLEQDHRHRVDNWLNSSRKHGCAAQNETSGRNKKLYSLDGWLSQPSYIEEAFQKAQYSLLSASASRNFCGQLFATWESVEKYMGSTYNGAAGCKAEEGIKELRKMLSEMSETPTSSVSSDHE